MWDTIHKAWQTAFELGWEAFVNGSAPIGAVITDENGNVISSGRNRLFEKSSCNPKIAHAETEAIQKLDIIQYPNIKSYTLYACAEPCPMCMGTFVMGNFKNLKIAARDSYCGAVHYCRDDPYIAAKKIKANFENGILETAQLVMGAYFDLKLCGGEISNVVKSFEKDNPAAIRTAKVLYAEKRLDWHVENKTLFSEIFKEIVLRAA